MRKKTATIALTASLIAYTGLVMAAVTEEIFLHVNQSADDYWHEAPANQVVLQCQKPSGASTVDFSAYHSGVPVIHESVEADSVSFGTGHVYIHEVITNIFTSFIGFIVSGSDIRANIIKFA